jgi:hypothetical protein
LGSTSCQLPVLLQALMRLQLLHLRCCCRNNLIFIII